MSGKQRGSGKMIQLADKLYANKKWSMGIPLGCAGISYVLALCFGGRLQVYGAIFAAPLMGAICFGGMFLVLGGQLINPFCPPGFMSFFELFFGLYFGAFSAFWFIRTGFWQLFGEDAGGTVVSVFMLAGAWCATCVVHNLRK